MKRSANPQLIGEVLAAMAELRFGLDASRIPTSHPGDVTPTTMTPETPEKDHNVRRNSAR